MASSKFSVRPVARKVPCIIHPAPPPDLPLAPGELPLQLSAMAHWRDLDPLAPTDMAAYIDLWKVIGLPAFFGRSAGQPYYLQLELERVDPLGWWTFKLSIFDPYRHPETMIYPDIFVDPKKPFESPIVGDINIPGFDFRTIKVLE